MTSGSITSSNASLSRIDFLVVLLALFGAALVALVVWQRAHYFSPGFSATPGKATVGWQVSAIERDSAAQGIPKHWLGATLTRACAAGTANCVDLASSWLIDSPIMLPRHTQVVEFIRSQQTLLALGTALDVFASDIASAPGKVEQARIELRPARHFFNERFALILISAVVIYTIGCAMIAFVRRTRAVWVALGMCSGFFLFMIMRSWYTNRDWAQPELAWWFSIQGFRTGVMLCGSCAVVSLWQLRMAGRKLWLPLGFCALLCGTVFLHALGIIDSSAWGYRYVTLGFLFFIVGSSAHIWWSAYRGSESERLRSRTLGRIFLLGFLPLVVTMPLWTFRPDLAQIGYLQNIAVGLAGIPVVISVSQSAQYQLHEFWWRLWLVLVAAVLALVGAAVLVLFSGASAGVSLVTMLGVAAVAIYFLRNWLEKRLIGKPPALEGFLPQLMQLQGLQGDELAERWGGMLREIFLPQQVQPVSELVAEPFIHGQGDHMDIPGLLDTPTLRLTGAANYTRSFNARDAELAQSLQQLASQGLAARSSYAQGAVQERRRIAADLHDDIGGKLLHLANSDSKEAQYARNTLEDLRTITRGLSAQPRQLDELLADIQYQLAQRAERADIDFEWETDCAGEAPTIGSRQSTVMASICSELLRNAMQHRGVSQVRFALAVVGGEIALSCINNGEVTEPSQWKAGLGTTSIRRRVYDLQGQCDWSARSEGGVEFCATWPLAAWMSADTGAFNAEDLKKL